MFLDGIESHKADITCGVPQGSILGPLLFLLYINDIANVSQLLLPIIFADDTNVFLKGKSVNETIDLMNLELVKIVKWLNVNRLSLNIEKTNFMIFRSNRRNISCNSDLTISGSSIKYTEHAKFIGILLDSNLKWDKHIATIKTKLARGLGILNKAKKSLSLPTLVVLYNTFIYPHYIYCIEAWGSAANIYLDPLSKIQKKIVRTITSSEFRAESAPLFLRLKILNINKIYKYRVNTFMFNFIKDLLPGIFQNIFKRNSARETRQKFKLYVPMSRNHSYSNTIRFQGVKEWNYVVDHVDHYCSVHTFKKRLKNFLLHN